MKSFRISKWFFLYIFLISILACATDHTVLQPPSSSLPPKEAPSSVLQKLSYSEEGGYTRIRLEGSDPIAPPASELLSNPLRLVIDLPNLDLKKVKEPIRIENGTIGEIWATQYDEKGRIEIHLTQRVSYNISREDRILNIDIEHAKKMAEVPKVENVREEKDTKQEKEAKDGEVKEEKEVKQEKSEMTPTPQKETEVTPVEVKVESLSAAPTAGTPSSPDPASNETKAKEITDVSLEKKEGSVSFTIVADGKLGNYDSFKLDSPQRLVLDIWEVNIKSPQKTIKLPNPYFKEIRVGQYPDKLRLVFDSSKSQMPPYQIQRLEDRLVLSVGNVSQSSGAQIAIQEKTGEPPKTKESPAEPPKLSEKTVPSGPARTSKASTLTAIDFKQMEDKSRIVVSVTEEPQVESFLISKKVLAVDLKNVTVPKHLQRGLDTSEFKSAVQSIQLQNIKRGKGNDVRILVKLREEVPYETSKEGKTLFIDLDNPKLTEAKAEVAPVTPKEETPPRREIRKEEVGKEVVKKEEGKQEEVKAPVEQPKRIKEPSVMAERAEPQPAPEKRTEDKRVREEGGPQEKAYTGRKISLDFKDADIKNILRLIAEVSNLNLIAGEDVTGKVTMRLVDVPWDQALDVILSARNLGMSRVGNVVRIAPQETLKRELQTELEAKRGKEKLEDLSTELIPVNYALAKELLPQVKSVLSERGDVKADDRTNILIVKDIPRNIVGIKSLVKQLDTKTPQVMIEARIVEANLTFQRELGVSWGFLAVAGKDTGNQVTTSGGLPGNKVVDLPALPKTGTAGVFEFMFNSAKGLRELDIAISAHENNGDVRIISSPKIATLDNKEASIEQGLRIPYLKLTTEGTVTTDFIEANLKLTVTPHVTNDGHIKLYIKARKDAPDQTITVQGVPSIDKKEAITEVLIKDNGVVVIGGIYTIEKNDGTEGIPLFSKIPLLGWFFKREAKEDKRKDLLIFISPKIVKDQI